MIRITTFAGKTVAVFGLGASGLATARALVAGDCEVAAWDDGVAAREAAGKAGIAPVDLEQANWSAFAALILAPGVPLTHPEPHWTVQRAREAGIEVIGDVELFFRQRAAECPEVRVVGITGTNGKSTTTALTAHLLHEAGFRVSMGGNIGRAVLDLEPFERDRVYVLELSSFQLDLTPSVSCSAAALLNVTPDHLDRHGSMENYALIKARILDNLGKGWGIAVIGSSDAYCRHIAEAHADGVASVITVSLPGEPCGNLNAADGHLFWQDDAEDEACEIASLQGVGPLRGPHNWQNAMAAYALAVAVPLTARLEALDTFEHLGPTDQVMSRMAGALRTYPGLPHRLEEVGRLGRVLFINDSKATNADSTAKALASFAGDIYWILGGKEKEGGIAGLAPWFGRIAKAYLIGAAAPAFARTLEGQVPFEHCGSLEVAVAKAAADAAQSSGAEPIVLLSPACASYDQFKSFEVRGNVFRDLVRALPGLRIATETAS